MPRNDHIWTKKREWGSVEWGGSASAPAQNRGEWASGLANNTCRSDIIPPNKGKCIIENGAVNVENLTLMAAVRSSLQMNETRRFLSCLVSSLRKHTNSLEREKKKKKKTLQKWRKTQFSVENLMTELANQMQKFVFRNPERPCRSWQTRWDGRVLSRNATGRVHGNHG